MWMLEIGRDISVGSLSCYIQLELSSWCLGGGEVG